MKVVIEQISDSGITNLMSKVITYKLDKKGDLSVLVIRADKNAISKEDSGNKILLIKLVDKLLNGEQYEVSKKLTLAIDYKEESE